jgi:hypothetical protein
VLVPALTSICCVIHKIIILNPGRK